MVNTLERAFVKWISISFIVLALIVALPAFSADVFVDEGDGDFDTTPIGGPAPASELVLLPAPPPVMQQPLAAEDGDDSGAYPPAQAQAAPVVIPIVAAVVGAVFTRVLSNTGDVSWELDQMNGLKHPNDQAPANLAPFQDGPTIRLTDWPITRYFDKKDMIFL